MASGGRLGSPSRASSSSSDPYSFESSLVTSPCKAVCNIFWGNRLAARPFTEGDERIIFSSLWPDPRTFVDLYKDGGMEVACCHIVKLLLSSCSQKPLEALVQQGLVSWDRGFQNGQFTLVHLVCALSSEPVLEVILKHAPQNGLWSTKDSNSEYAQCYLLNH